MIAALIALTSSLIVASFTALLAFRRYLTERKHERETLLNALFGELANLLEHYSYASHELPEDTTNGFELEKRLRWAKYGNLRSANDVRRLGLLDAYSVRALLQLELTVRNDGLLLDQLIAAMPQPPLSELVQAKARLRRRLSDVNQLVSNLSRDYPRLQAPLALVKRDLPYQMLNSRDDG